MRAATCSSSMAAMSLQAPRAPRAFEHVEAKGALHQQRPREAPLAAGDVGAGGITTKASEQEGVAITLLDISQRLK